MWKSEGVARRSKPRSICIYVCVCVYGNMLYTPYTSVSQPPGRGPVPGPGINYTGPCDVLLECDILVF